MGTASLRSGCLNLNFFVDIFENYFRFFYFFLLSCAFWTKLFFLILFVIFASRATILKKSQELQNAALRKYVTIATFTTATVTTVTTVTNTIFTTFIITTVTTVTISTFTNVTISTVTSVKITTVTQSEKAIVTNEQI